MIDIKGKYNTAHVMIDQIDDTTTEQIQLMMDQPMFEGGNVAIMPDCHKGAGAVIGFTMPVNEYVIPNIIGVDIGCGVAMNIYDIKADSVDLKRFDESIHREIPSGFNIHDDPLNIGRASFVIGLQHVCDTIGVEYHKALRAIGTLGGGNHFIELGKTEDGRVAVTVHSGSRNLGKRAADYFQNIAREELAAAGVVVPKGLEYLRSKSQSGGLYIGYLHYAQEYARYNRKAILDIISNSILKSDPVDHTESVHNYIDGNGIIRKGAVSAKKGERLLIPFNMRDGIAICLGKGNLEWNTSAPHGAGRILSRTQAKAKLNVEAFQEGMAAAGVYTTTANAGTLDEAPDAYKSKDVIIEAIKPTADVLEYIKPLYNFKGC
jgi:RNA-splicing ligase RtcB